MNIRPNDYSSSSAVRYWQRKAQQARVIAAVSIVLCALIVMLDW